VIKIDTVLILQQYLPNFLPLATYIHQEVLSFFNQFIPIKEFTFNISNLFVVVFTISYILFFKIWEAKGNARYQKYIIKCRMKEQPDALEDLALFSFREAHAIMINLKSGKSYIGIVIEIDADTGIQKNGFFQMMVFASGFRNRDTMNFTITNEYEAIWQDMYSNARPEELKTLENILSNSMIFNIQEIVSATVWLEEVYQQQS